MRQTERERERERERESERETQRETDRHREKPPGKSFKQMGAATLTSDLTSVGRGTPGDAPIH